MLMSLLSVLWMNILKTWEAEVVVTLTVATQLFSLYGKRFQILLKPHHFIWCSFNLTKIHCAVVERTNRSGKNSSKDLPIWAWRRERQQWQSAAASWKTTYWAHEFYYYKAWMSRSKHEVQYASSLCCILLLHHSWKCRDIKVKNLWIKFCVWVCLGPVRNIEIATLVQLTVKALQTTASL